MFLKRCTQKLQTLDGALNQQDREILRATAHAFKGNAADVGADALHATLNTLEQQALSESFASLQSLFETAKQQVAEITQIFEQYLHQQS